MCQRTHITRVCCSIYACTFPWRLVMTSRRRTTRCFRASALSPAASGGPSLDLAGKFAARPAGSELLLRS